MKFGIHVKGGSPHYPPVWNLNRKIAILWNLKREKCKFLAFVPPFLGLVESQIAYFVRKRANRGISKRNFEKFSKVGGKRFYDFKKS